MSDRDCAICRGTGKYPASVDITGKLADCPDCTPETPNSMRSALVAIQELHKPVHPFFSWQEGLKLEEPCPTCHGKAGVHECGCWADNDTEFFCAECSDFEIGKGRRTPYPCATRRLADDALTARTTKNGDKK